MPYLEGFAQVLNELEGVTNELAEKNRRQLIDTSLDDIKNLAGMLEDFLSSSSCTVIGNEQVLKNNSEIFDVLTSLI